MNTYIIETAEPHKMRYPTVGDWYDNPKNPLLTYIIVAKLDDWKKEACVAVHELVEQLICKAEGITSELVDTYDKDHEESGDEPDIPGSPYRRAHFVAYIIEMMLAKELGLDWTEYGKTLNAAYEKIPNETRASL